MAIIGSTLHDGDWQTILADTCQTELGQLQRSLLCDRITCFSEEVASMRSEMKNLRCTEEKLGKIMRAESIERDEFANKLEMSIKAVAEGLDTVYLEVKAEVVGRRQSEEGIVSSVSTLRNRVDEIAHRASYERGGEAFSNAAEDGGLKLADTAAQVHDIAGSKILQDDQKETELELARHLEGYLQQNRSVEASLEHLRAEISCEVAARRHDIKVLKDTIQTVQAQISRSIEDESQKRVAADESLVRGSNSLLQAMEMEQQERIRGGKNTLAAIEMNSQATEAMKKGLTQEVMHQSDMIAELRSELAAAKQQIDGQSNRLYEVVEDISAWMAKKDGDLKQVLMAFQKEVEQNLQLSSEQDAQLRCLIQTTSEKLALLNEQATENTRGLEEAVRAVGQAKSEVQEEEVVDTHTDTKTTHHSAAIKRDLYRYDPAQPRFSELIEQIRSEQNERHLGEAGLRHLLNSCRQEISVVRQERMDDYTALRSGLECLDRETEREFASLRQRIDEERQEGISNNVSTDRAC